jgi:multidrug resistance efflux pump
MPEFSVEGLKRGIEQAEKNIQTFEDAIRKEQETIGQYKWMIEQAKRKEKEREAAKILPDYAQRPCAVNTEDPENQE